MASYNCMTTIRIISGTWHSSYWYMPNPDLRNRLQGFTKAPNVYATPVQRQPEKEGDVSLIWVESISTFGFKLCLRELKNFDGVHSNIRAVSENIYNTYLLTLL